MNLLMNYSMTAMSGSNLLSSVASFFASHKSLANLLEGYGNDNPGAKSQGMKQFMAGAGVMLIGALLVPKLKDLIPATLS